MIITPSRLYIMTPKQRKGLQKEMSDAHFDHQKGLNAHAFFKVNDRELSLDLVQDTFVKTWKFLAKGGKIDIMKAFLYHVLNGLVIDQYRKHKTASLDVLLEKGFEPSDNADSGHLVNLIDGKAALLLIPLLPLTYQKVIRMRYVQDLSLREISLITGQSKNTIAVQIHRGLQKLKLLHQHKK